MAKKHSYLFTLVVIFAAISLVFTGPTWAKVEGDTIIFGAAVSFTGKYSTNGKHTKNGYDLAVKRINEKGGVNAVNLRIAEQYLNEFGKLAKTNNSIIIPSNLSDIAGMIKAAATVIKDQTQTAE